MITIVIVDDQPTVRAGLRMRLALEEDIEIIGTAQDGKNALDVVSRLRPDIVIMDLEMPIMDHDDETTRKRAREAGAAGFVSKHADDSVLLNVIRALASREK